jgi:hypothetical protein
MRRILLSLLLAITAIVGTSAAGPEAKYKAPRTESGHPDLRGVWNFSSGVPLQRPAKLAEKKFFTQEEFDKQRAALFNALASIARFAPVEAVGLDWIDSRLHVADLRTSLINYPENGRLPGLAEGVGRMANILDVIAALADGPSPELFSLISMLTPGKRDSYEDFTVAERCLFGPEVPFLPGFSDNHLQVVQGTDHVALLTDEFHRVVALDSKARPGERVRSWTGISRGHWEGDTLVVETKNFNDRTTSFGGMGNARGKVVTERFTRTSTNTLEYAAVVVDPKTFKDRIELSFPMARVDAHLFESACHEGNYSMANILSAVRTEERAANTK